MGFTVSSPRAARPRVGTAVIVVLLVALVAALVVAPGAPAGAQAATQAECKNGKAGGYVCKNIDLVGFVDAAVMGGARIADVWGWVDPETDREYALLGSTRGVQILDVTNPRDPVYLGNLLGKADSALIWQEIEILNDHLYAVCDLSPCGLQIFDLSRLRGVEAALPVWRPDVVVPLGSAHSIDSNPETNHIFVNGGGVAVGTPVIFDVSQPLAPVPVGAMADDGYTHDSLCRNYHGPDKAFKGNEICFNFNEDSITIYDVTSNP
ncbi:MAG: choice-of-anchor B family protein, partial [Actinomycetota bacterium]|nr:choice-of-anchor B family protein [Actinomycetota bacterium]